MKKRTFITSTAAAAVVAAILPSCGNKADDDKETGGGGNSSDKVLRFSAIPDENVSKLKVGFDKIAVHLSEKLGVKVEYVPSVSYKASVEAFAQGDVQLAWFGGLSGVQARARVDGAHAIAQGKVDPDYFSYFIAHKDTGLEFSEDFPEGLAGKSFTFGSPDSTSGRLMPEHFIRDITGKSPKELFGSEPLFSNGHDKTAINVAEGKVDVGALSYRKYDTMVEDKLIDPEVCKIIWKTPFYSDYNWTTHPDLEEKFGEGFTEKLTAEILALPEDLLKVMQRKAMIEAKDSDFQDIVKLAKQYGYIK